MARVQLQGDEFITITRDGGDVEIKVAQYSLKTEDGREQLVLTKLELGKSEARELYEALGDALRDY